MNFEIAMILSEAESNEFAGEWHGEEGSSEGLNGGYNGSLKTNRENHEIWNKI